MRGKRMGTLRHRRLVLLATIALAVAAVPPAMKVRFDSSIESWFLEDDPGLSSYREFLLRFESDEFAVLALIADDLFAPRTLQALSRITRDAATVPNVEAVRSLANVDSVWNQGGAFRSGRVIESLPRTISEAEAIRARVLDDETLVGTFLSPSGKAAAVFVRMDPAANSFEGKAAMVEGLREIASRESRAGVKVALAGSPVFDTAFFLRTRRDFRLVGPLALLLVLLLLAVVFRSIRISLLAVSVVLLALLMTFAVMGLFGLSVTVVTSSLVPLVLAVGVADGVHVVAETERSLSAGMEMEEAVTRAVRRLRRPCLVTSATTAAGLLSLYFSGIRPVRQFGCLAALAVLLAYLLSMSFLPAALVSMSRIAKPRPLPRFVTRLLAPPSLLRARMLLLLAALILVLSLPTMSWIGIGANPMNYFEEGDPMRRETELVDQALGGTTSLEAMVRIPKAGVADPDFLDDLENAGRWLASVPGVSRTRSIVSYLKRLRRVLLDRPAESMPGSRREAAELLLLLDGSDAAATYLDAGQETARLTTFVRMSDADQVVDSLPLMEDRLSTLFGPDKAVLTGYVKLMRDMEGWLLSGQIFSLGIAAAVITLMLCLVLGSLRLGLFSLIPNIGPIVLGMTLMGLAGIALDPGTIMIASIALGLVVDDTVHFLVRYRDHARAMTVERAIQETLGEVARPIIVTSLVLAVGFSILMIGSFAPNVEFGLVSSVVILGALLADLFLLPAALVALRPDLRQGGSRPLGRHRRSP